MTLQERLIKYMNDNNLTGVAMALLTDSDPNDRSAIRKHNKCGPIIRKKLFDALGPDFEEYLEYKTCRCGKQFIQRSANQHHCSSECSEKYTGRPWGSRQMDKSEMHRLTAYEKEKLLERKQKFPKPKVGYAEFNERARSQGLSYGQLQGLERLGIDVQQR